MNAWMPPAWRTTVAPGWLARCAVETSTHSTPWRASAAGGTPRTTARVASGTNAGVARRPWAVVSAGIGDTLSQVAGLGQEGRRGLRQYRRTGVRARSCDRRAHLARSADPGPGRPRRVLR